MNHLDEGTIHAWIDGALDAAQSAEIDAHVKSCAECSAKVAEARGLIAASSRILTSLDDVPANVTPKRALAPTPRRRRMAPWVSGLAAAAILVTLWRTGDVRQPAQLPQIAVPEIATVSVPEPSLAPLSQPEAPRVAKAAAPPRRAGEERQARVGNVAGAGAGGAASDLASAQVAPVAAAPAPPVARPEEAQRRESFAAEARLRARVDSASLEGCYQLASLDEVVVTSANVESRPAERLRRPSGAPAAATARAPAAQKLADAAAPAIVVRLDSANVVRTLALDSIGRWIAVGIDSVRIYMGTQPKTVSASSKVRCP